MKRALEFRREILTRQPDDLSAVLNYADLALRLDRRDEARQALEASHQKHPGRFAVRRRLRELDGKGGEPWWAPYDVKVEDLTPLVRPVWEARRRAAPGVGPSGGLEQLLGGGRPLLGDGLLYVLVSGRKP
jgi:hypothetical protein